MCQLRAEISQLVPAVANGLSRAYQAGADEEHCGLEKVLICLLYCAEADTCCRFVYDVLGEMCVYEDANRTYELERKDLATTQSAKLVFIKRLSFLSHMGCFSVGKYYCHFRVD